MALQRLFPTTFLTNISNPPAAPTSITVDDQSSPIVASSLNPIVKATASIDDIAKDGSIYTYNVILMLNGIAVALDNATDLTGTQIETGYTITPSEGNVLALSDTEYSVIVQVQNLSNNLGADSTASSVLVNLNSVGCVRRYSSRGTLSQDEAGTTPATASNDPIGRIVDSMGSGKHATQSTSTAQPRLKLGGVNGLPVIQFDGGDGLAVDGLDLFRNIPGAMITALVKYTTLDTTLRPLFHASIGTGAGARISLRATSSIFDVRSRRLDNDTIISSQGGTPNINDWFVHTGVFDYANGSQQLRINGEQLDSDTYTTGGNTSDTDGQTIRIGDDGAGTNFMIGNLIELLIWVTIPTAAVRDAVETYLKAIVAPPVPDDPPLATEPIFDPDTFVTRSGNRLYVGEEEFSFAGANMHWCVVTTDGGRLAPPTNVISSPSEWRIRNGFEQARLLGCNAVRLFGGTHGYEGTLHPSLGVLDEDVFARMDYAVAQARAYGIRLIMTICLSASAKLKYWGSMASFNYWGAGSESAFWSNATAIANYKSFITSFINRVNTVNGLRYGDDPTIMAWETGNELSPTSAWTATIAAHIKSLTSQLVVDGKWGVATSSLTNEHVDIISNHFYPMKTSNLNSDMGITNISNKVYIIGEYDWFRQRSGGNTLSDFLAAIESYTDLIQGDMFWDLSSHSDDYGWGQDSDDYYDVAQPGFYDVRFGDPAKQASIVMLRNHAYRRRNIVIQDYPIITEVPVFRHTGSYVFTWRGVAGGLTYTIERSTTSDSTGYSVVASDLTDVDGTWTDSSPSGGTAWYRIYAINGDGVASPVSNAVSV